MIRNVFHPGNHAKSVDFVLLFLRLAVGILMLTHGSGKFSKLFGDDPIHFADPIGVGEKASLALTVFAEVLCSILLILGLATRFAAVPLLITMLVAVFIVHANDGIAKQEMAMLYGAIYLLIAITGAGKISVDHYIHRKIIQA